MSAILKKNVTWLTTHQGKNRFKIEIICSEIF